MDFPPHPFWDFSVTLYGKPGVAPACLALQDRHELDVNLVMFCLWLGASGRGPVPRERLAPAFDAVGKWHAQVVRTLRPLRRRLKFGFDPVKADLVQGLRARIQKIEVDAEHVEQLTLAATSVATAPGRADMAADEAARHGIEHLAAYFAHIGARPDADDAHHLCVILAAAFALPDPALRAHLAQAFG